MKATETYTRNNLPSDYEKIDSYSWELTLAYQQLLEKRRKLLVCQFGKSVEKLNMQTDLNALHLKMDELFEQITAVNDAETEDTTELIEIPSHKRRRKKHSRN